MIPFNDTCISINRAVLPSERPSDDQPPHAQRKRNVNSKIGFISGFIALFYLHSPEKIYGLA